ncbi:hypothetical protein VOLCADRAFT_91290 [Volvox carteri f. nagariensis]|uniref:Uncharacterized protein n=1 Tax=Volvox carteri f. nagariensis TaxID=3068 RepID=D8TWN5_VOLCA|nr:uncharacterized protein VOLCADRAFT_91290 [Volvox carteri f. nagariensis]EFJ48082.1 hypothetical protein VOLCADRAFT_91290 [Volvox carteri f. nagariensis]|eukprot:XP_002950767.1 hypothetical protein VOLCADRAFT_91290 [Volvox carteri f. nagariensis]
MARSQFNVHAVSVLVALVFVASTSVVWSRRVADTPNGPVGAIIAVANLSGTPSASGRVVLSWYNSSAHVNVTLKGSLTNITMAHIHLNDSSRSNPVIAGLLPRMNSWLPKQLNPPVSYDKPYTFNIAFDARYLAMVTSDMTAETFLSLLKQGQLFVNVHTVAQPTDSNRFSEALWKLDKSRTWLLVKKFPKPFHQQPLLRLLKLLSESYAVASGENAVALQWSSRHLLTKSIGGDFPFCKCTTYNCLSSPYRLSYTGAYPVMAGTRHCFMVRHVGCTTNTTCCAALQRNVHKISFSVGAGCLKPVTSQVEINGRKWSSWSTVFTKRGTDTNGTVVFGYDVRIYDMQFNATTFPGTSICMTTKEPCASIQQLCGTTTGTCKPVNTFFSSPENCSRTSSIIISNFTAALEAAGVSIRQPFTWNCTGNYEPGQSILPRLFVCGLYDVPASRTVLEEALRNVTASWVAFVIGTPVVLGQKDRAECPVGLEGYAFEGALDSGINADPRCPYGSSVINCTERYAPFPPSPLPPLPPPSPVPVKTHNCSQATKNVPYYLDKIETYNTTDRSGQRLVAMCTTIQEMDCNDDAKCCGMDAAKVEVIMKPSCQDALRSITVNGKEIAYSRSFYTGFTSLKFVKLLALGDPAAMRLCWYASPGPCASPGGFCYNNRCQRLISPYQRPKSHKVMPCVNETAC